MKIKLLFIINLLIIPFVYAETVYKTRDAEGNVIFSDILSVDAEVIEIQEAQTLNMPKVKGLDYRRTTKLVLTEIKYTQLDIISPENNGTIRSNVGTVNINIEMTPALDKKHMIVLSMDGKELSSGKSLQFSLPNIKRGTHTVDVVVKNEKDKVLKRSDKLVFHMRKFSKLFKNRTDEAQIQPIIDNTGVITESSDNTPATIEIPSL